VFSLIQARGFRSLRYVQQLRGFHVLVGANATGKSTFLDVPAFLKDLMDLGPDGAVEARGAQFDDLTWGKQGGDVELAVEARIPEKFKSKRDFVRYEVRLVVDRRKGPLIQQERVLLVKRSPQAQLPYEPADSIFLPKQAGNKQVVAKVSKGNDSFYPEVKKQPSPSFKLGPKKSTFQNLPDDERLFPVATWFRRLLTTDLQKFVLDSEAMRRPSPPSRAHGFRPDGSNLPWVVDKLKPASFRRWIEHVQTALPDLENIRVIRRAEDNSKYLVVKYRQGFDLPSWMVSDGTLRLLALTLPAYLDAFQGVFLIEEPENGIHPQAVETVVQSLRSVRQGQVLLASHSPIVLGMLEPSDVLCFSKDAAGETAIVPGVQHPALLKWKKSGTNLGSLFAAGILSV
jgi:predicted ATPase